ncbi:Hypothetical predicted protein [Mytilus galloprovincialis]|uniref:Uncharacterized protein n=1 Tax=Mytilus galloprovincialis TaxID=29158 RepID=A0A8B6DJL5_MYTGA|nr:Hypothetical predicted protein [Mytilus galloprovincialis]
MDQEVGRPDQMLSSFYLMLKHKKCCSGSCHVFKQGSQDLKKYVASERQHTNQG